VEYLILGHAYDEYSVWVLKPGMTVGYHLTTTIIKLHQFIGPHNFSMWPVQNQVLVQGPTTNGPLSTQAGATTLEL
jgi:hypothetical protein